MRGLFLLLLFMMSIHARELDNVELRHCQRYAWIKICDFVYDDDAKTKSNPPFNPKDVFPGSVVFVSYHSVERFFREIHPQIESPYILLLMLCYRLPIQRYLDDSKIIACFCSDLCHNSLIDSYKASQYCSLKSYKSNPLIHPKIVRIPIGIGREEKIFEQFREYEALFNALRSAPKGDKVYMNYTLHPWSPLRKKIYTLFKDKPYVVNSCNSKKSFDQYMKEMATCKFTLSPQGDLLDCYRHWEAILVGTIPIIQRTSASMDEMFEGLPVLLIDDWTAINENFLNEKYAEIKSKQYNLEKLYMKYWVDRINKVKNDFLSQYSPIA